MRSIKDGLIIILGLFGLVSIQAWQKLLGRNVGYYDWPNRSLKEHNEAAEAIYRSVCREWVKELYGRSKAEHRPTA